MANSSEARKAIVQRGQEIYEKDIRPKVESQHYGKFLAVETDSGEYEIDEQEINAIQRARARNPGGQLYLIRIGHSSAYNLGSGSLVAKR
jgi:hypothetical protein